MVHILLNLQKYVLLSVKVPLVKFNMVGLVCFVFYIEPYVHETVVL